MILAEVALARIRLVASRPSGMGSRLLKVWQLPVFPSVLMSPMHSQQVLQHGLERNHVSKYACCRRWQSYL